MTREVKLSLILGFAVVLAVGVLLSDHLSGARQARVDGVNPERGIEPVTMYSAAEAEPALILVDEQGRPQQPAKPTQPAPRPGDPRQKSFAPTVVADASGPQPVNAEETTLLKRLQQRAANGLHDAVNDLASGHTPPPTVSLATNEYEPVRFDQPQPIDPNAGVPTAYLVQEEPEAAELVEATPTVPTQSDRGFVTYDVREGDTLWSIASKQLGDGRRHTEISELNRDRLGKGGVLRAGATLRLPGEATGDRVAQNGRQKPVASQRETVEPAPTMKKNGKTVYTVKSGDTLGGIAAKYLGSSSKYDDLLLANAGTLTDEDSLEVGMELMIPGR